MFNPLMWIAEALNAIKSNVWAAGLIGIGAVLTLHGHSDVGGSILTGGFAILRAESVSPVNFTQPNPPASPAPVTPPKE